MDKTKKKKKKPNFIYVYITQCNKYNKNAKKEKQLKQN